MGVASPPASDDVASLDRGRGESARPSRTGNRPDRPSRLGHAGAPSWSAWSPPGFTAAVPSIRRKRSGWPWCRASSRSLPWCASATGCRSPPRRRSAAWRSGGSCDPARCIAPWPSCRSEPPSSGVSRRLAGHQGPRRPRPGPLALALVAVAAVTAVVGIICVLWRIDPLAQHVGTYWQLATWLTLPAAAAALLAVGLILALALDLRQPFQRIAVCLLVAAFIGTQSHWALLALAAGAAFVPAGRWRAAWWPLAMGVLAGVVVVVSASGHLGLWSSTLLAAAIVGAAGWRSPRAGRCLPAPWARCCSWWPPAWLCCCSVRRGSPVPPSHPARARHRRGRPRRTAGGRRSPEASGRRSCTRRPNRWIAIRASRPIPI